VLTIAINHFKINGMPMMKIDSAIKQRKNYIYPIE